MLKSLRNKKERREEGKERKKKKREKEKERKTNRIQLMVLTSPQLTFKNFKNMGRDNMVKN